LGRSPNETISLVNSKDDIAENFQVE
jgi:hypothetical protein